jgi:hypothetical protein
MHQEADADAIMNHLNLNIAGYIIGFESETYKLEPSGKFRNFIIHKNKSTDLLIRVHRGKREIPGKPVEVFSAQLEGEIIHPFLISNSDFWSILEYDGSYFMNVVFPLRNNGAKAIMEFSLQSRTWDLWIDGADAAADPLEYPLDGLILYYLTVISGDIMIHSSGINYEGKGYIFSGISGKGKSTMAGLWKEAGAFVVHDDRLILRETRSGYKMYNTPVYEADVSRESDLHRIFVIEHGDENTIERVTGARASALLMANCIQHNWSEDIISGLLESVTDLCSRLPVFKLSFSPDKNVIDYILNSEQT